MATISIDYWHYPIAEIFYTDIQHIEKIVFNKMDKKMHGQYPKVRRQVECSNIRCKCIEKVHGPKKFTDWALIVADRTRNYRQVSGKDPYASNVNCVWPQGWCARLSLECVCAEFPHDRLVWLHLKFHGLLMLGNWLSSDLWSNWQYNWDPCGILPPLLTNCLEVS